MGLEFVQRQATNGTDSPSDDQSPFRVSRVSALITCFLRNVTVAFFLLGTINNLPYVVVNSSAKVLASSFDKDNYVTLVMFANVAFGFFSKGTNVLLSLTKFPFWIRYLVNGCLMLVGLIGVAYAPNFWVALAAIVFAGCSASFGENLTLGYLHNYPRECVNAWSSGTGMAGLFGAVLYLALSCIAENTIISGMKGSYYFDPQSSEYTEKLKNINRFVFLGTIPIVALYWISYFVVMTRPTDEIRAEHIQEHNPLLRGDDSNSVVTSGELPVHKENTCLRVLRCFKITSWLSLNAGVFVSRSSVQLVHIKRIEIFTILQLINLVLWAAQVWWKFLPVSVLPAFMVYVGLLGGASYVNTFYILRTNTKKFPEKDRELCINVTAMWITFGILFGASFPLALFETIFSNK